MSSERRSPTRPGPFVVGLGFLVHPLEEAATDFPLWLRSTVGGDLDPVTFAVINTVGVIVVTAAVTLHRRRGDLPVVPTAVGTLMLLNATIHAAAALASAGYVPGVVTSVLVWAPLGILLLREGRAAGGRVFGQGLAVGVSVHVLVTATVLLV